MCRELLACKLDSLASGSSSVLYDVVCSATIEVHIRIMHPNIYSVRLKVTTIVFVFSAFSQ
jgi:hypothetical protein